MASEGGGVKAAEGGKLENHLVKHAQRVTEMGGLGSRHLTRLFKTALIMLLLKSLIGLTLIVHLMPPEADLDQNNQTTFFNVKPK